MNKIKVPSYLYVWEGYIEKSVWYTKVFAVWVEKKSKRYSTVVNWSKSWNRNQEKIKIIENKPSKVIFYDFANRYSTSNKFICVFIEGVWAIEITIENFLNLFQEMQDLKIFVKDSLFIYNWRELILTEGKELEYSWITYQDFEDNLSENDLCIWEDIIMFWDLYWINSWKIYIEKNKFAFNWNSNYPKEYNLLNSKFSLNWKKSGRIWIIKDILLNNISLVKDFDSFKKEAELFENISLAWNITKSYQPYSKNQAKVLGGLHFKVQFKKGVEDLFAGNFVTYLWKKYKKTKDSIETYEEMVIEFAPNRDIDEIHFVYKK